MCAKNAPFNYPQINWPKGFVGGADESEPAQFYDTTQNALLHQHVDFDTRYRDGCASSLLDLVFTNREYLVDEVEANQPLGKSDHVVLMWKCVYKDRPCELRADSAVVSYNYKKGNFSGMRAKLSETNWQELADLNVQDTWRCIKMSYWKAYSFTYQKKNHRGGVHTPWWSKVLTKEVKKKHKMWKQYVTTQSAEDHIAYKQQRNVTSQAIRNTRGDYENRLVSEMKQDPQKLHRYIRAQLKVKPRVGPLEKKKSGEMIKQTRKQKKS